MGRRIVHCLTLVLLHIANECHLIHCTVLDELVSNVLCCIVFDELQFPNLACIILMTRVVVTLSLSQ